MCQQELRDDQWAIIEPFVPGGRKGKRGPRSNGRSFINALLWLARSGARWRDIPPAYGKYQTIKRRYYRWLDDGIMHHLKKFPQGRISRFFQQIHLRRRQLKIKHKRMQGGGVNLVAQTRAEQISNLIRLW